MGGDERLLVLCLNLLRWLGLSFTRIRRCRGGEFVASDSKFHLLVNVAIVGVFACTFWYINPTAFSDAGVVKTPTIIYLLYTKLITLTIVALSLCGNVYNRKFIRIINLSRRVTQGLEWDLGRLGPRKGKAGYRIVPGFCAYMVTSATLSLWTDIQLDNRYEKAFRTVHYFCYSYVILFTAHFVITMDYIKGKFEEVNGAFGEAVASGALGARRRMVAWMTAFMDLGEAEGLANEIFGKQIFLTMLLAFSRVIANAYYLVTLNLYGRSSSSLNATMCVGLFQAVSVALLNTTAAERTANEANKFNQMIFHFPVHLHDWQMFNQLQYFALFSHCYRVEFKVWIFYALNYDSLLKVILTSSAITVIILQCDLLKI